MTLLRSTSNLAVGGGLVICAVHVAGIFINQRHGDDGGVGAVFLLLGLIGIAVDDIRRKSA